MSDKTSLGDRMKLYENAEAGRRLMPLVPAMARLDGRAFHSFCRGLERPCDPRLTRLMTGLTGLLVECTGASMGYTQSDEITLAWHSDRMESQIFFDGRVCKMVSQLAAIATLQFNKALPEFLPEKAHLDPLFDARVWSVPGVIEAANVFVWRELDAVKNSIAMAAQSVFSPRELHGKHGGEMQEMLFEQGINWNDYPASFKRGSYVQRKKVLKKFTCDEIERLPPKHAARTNPDLMIERSVCEPIEMPPITKVLNREAVIFDGAAPVTA